MTHRLHWTDFQDPFTFQQEYCVLLFKMEHEVGVASGPTWWQKEVGARALPAGVHHGAVHMEMRDSRCSS